MKNCWFDLQRMQERSCNAFVDGSKRITSRAIAIWSRIFQSHSDWSHSRSHRRTLTTGSPTKPNATLSFQDRPRPFEKSIEASNSGLTRFTDHRNLEYRNLLKRHKLHSNAVWQLRLSHSMFQIGMRHALRSDHRQSNLRLRMWHRRSPSCQQV